ncbi:MAG: ATP-dependent DNA helicase [Thermodesulfobacteriota bacterium]
MAALFAAGGPLARHLPGFEHRPGQAAMARRVAETLAAGGVLAVEAGTGIGKTLAYLVPAVLSRQRVVVSTGTINLQEQLLGKEIPFLRRHLDPDLSALLVKGRHNYLCRRRCQELLASPTPGLAGAEERQRLGRWQAATRTGDRAELDWLADEAPLWHAVAASSDRCLGSDCPESSACFVAALRKAAAAARLLVVNHHLFFSDLALRRTGFAEVLPRYESVIFDEAQHLEAVATQFYGQTLGQQQLLELARDVETAVTREGLPGPPALLQLARALASEAALFAALFPAERGRFLLAPLRQARPDWPQQVARLAGRLQGLADALAGEAAAAPLAAAFQRRAQDLADRLALFGLAPDPGQVLWYERRERSVQLAASPLEVGRQLAADLYPQVRAVILTSATLTVQGRFDYLQDRLGLDRDLASLVIPSPYDFAGRTLLYVPEAGFPEPGTPGFPPVLAARIEALLHASRGRALVLFTSMASMHAVHRHLAGCLPYPLLVQGSRPRAALLAAFQAEVDSVLLAVASFWEGVDVPGETLSCLIIDKLPFEVPSDPVVTARIERIRTTGGNPFREYQLPRAVMTLRQGVGRLMRSAHDAGVLAIMDVRLFTRPYGRIFLDSLPPSPLTRDLAAVERFFEDLTRDQG